MRGCSRAGGAGGGVGAGGRAGAAADHGGDAAGDRVFDLLRADEVDVGIDAAGGDDAAFAGDDFGGGADDQRWSMPRWMCGLPALPMPTMRPSLMPMSALMMPPVVEDQGVGDDEVAMRRLIGPSGHWAMPSRMTLPPPNFTSSP